YYYQRKFTQARDNYRLAHDTAPATGDYATLQEAMMLGLLGKQKEKIATLDRLVTTYPHSPLAADALTEKALAYASVGNTAEAIAVYNHIGTAYPATSQGRNALLQLAIQYLNSGRRDEAVNGYKRVISTYPSSAEAAMAVQDLTRIMGEDDRIDELTAFLASVDGAPQADSVELNALAAASLLRKVKAASGTDAIALATELLIRYPDAEGAEQALAIRAKALLDEGRTEDALADYTELDRRASTPAMHHSARMGILTAASELGHHDIIISTATTIKGSSAATGTDLPRVNFLLACALHDTGRTDDAMAIWTEMAKTPADLYGTRAAIARAEAIHDAGRTTEAIDAVNTLIDANPPHSYWMARAFILLSDLLRAEGSDFEADEYLRVLRANYPGTDADIFQMIDQRLHQ
ncbi:MAG: tetratricopeptide repeat protein, partial [Muribaculaceae bacterium]|nr:tetratricopeptide repeat protein [Muribaculaceae bacterium]